MFSLRLSLGILLLGSTALQAQQGKGPRLGSWNDDVRDAKGVVMRVAAQIPRKLPPLRALGLLLIFHGMNGNAYITGIVDGMRRVGILDHCVLLSGKSKEAGWGPNDDDAVLRLRAWALENYPVDPRRVFLYGSSNGAAMAGRFGWEHQDLIAGVIGYCGGYYFSGGPSGEKAGDSKTEFYFVHGGNDSPENSGAPVRELRARGYRAVFRKLDGYGHTDIWDGASVGARGHREGASDASLRELRGRAAARHDAGQAPRGG
jgi:poly(3-hydroxybutyrate) depolymerase